MNPDPKTRLALDPLLLLLVGMMVFFALLTLLVAWKLSSDGQTFQVMSGCLLTVLGYFGGLIKGRMEKDPTIPVAPGTTITTVEKQSTPAEPLEPVK